MNEENVRRCAEWLRNESGLELEMGMLGDEFEEAIKSWLETNIGLYPFTSLCGSCAFRGDLLAFGHGSPRVSRMP